MSAMGSSQSWHGWPLVGREAEMTEIAAGLEAADAGGVVLAGAPGVGKTRLAREVLARAQRMARDVDYVVATLAAASVPFGALSHVLTDCPRPGAGRFAMLRHAVEEVAARAARSRVVLGVDDAHLLDEESAALIHQLVVHGHVFVVATIRVGEPAPDAITALWKDGLARRLNLRPLTRAAVDELLSHALGHHIDGRTRQQIRRVTAGNPLLLRELLTGALEEAALVRSFGVWHWDKGPRYGTSLVELVEGRLAALGEAARNALEVVACGEPLAATVLVDLTDRGALEPGAVEEAERHSFIARERSGRREVLLPAHPIHGEIIRAVIPVGKSRQIWRWLIDAAAGRPLRRRDDVLRLAKWHLEAGTPQNRSELIAAANEAVLRADLVLAERLVRVAHDVVARDVTAGPYQGHALAKVLTWQGRHREATAALPDAPPAGGGDERRVAWALTRAWNRYWGVGQPAEAIRELDEVPPGTAKARADVDGTGAWLLLYSGQCRRALDSISAVAADGSAGTAWPFPLAAAVLANALAGRTDTAIALADRGLTLTARDGTAVWDGVMLGWPRCLALFLSGRTWAAAAFAEDGYAAAVAHGTDNLMIAIWAACRGKVALAQGRVAAAEAALREAVTLLAERDNYQFSRCVLAELAGVIAQTGDASAAQEWMKRSDARRTDANLMFEPWAELKRAWVIAASGELTRAAGQARHAADLARAVGQHAVEAEALYDAVRLGHPMAAPARLGELTEALDGALAPVLAAAAAAFGSLDGRRLDEVAAAFDDLGLLLHAAEAAGAAARSHRAQGHAACASASRQHLAILMDACKGARTPLLRINGDETSLGLTRREREIAVLAASGLSSKAIAAKLTLSVRTISNHLAHVYAKLGVVGRNELAAHFNPADWLRGDR